jgi:hypothetical protein
MSTSNATRIVDRHPVGDLISKPVWSAADMVNLADLPVALPLAAAAQKAFPCSQLMMLTGSTPGV